jgi:CHRD domain
MSLHRKSLLFAAILMLEFSHGMKAIDFAPVPNITLGAVLASTENPANRSNGFGTATFTIDAGVTFLAVDESVSGIGPSVTVTGAGIHKGAAGTNGPVVVAFDPIRFLNGHLSQTITGADPAILSDIIAHPDQYYTDVETTNFPSGVIRGQLALAGGATLLGGELRASNEPSINGSTSPAVGAFSITIDPSHTVLTWEMNVGSLQSPTRADIHKGTSAENTPAVLSLIGASGPSFVGKRAHGVIVAPDSATVALFADMASNPPVFIFRPVYYLDVQSASAPAGALRGQIVAVDPNNEWNLAVAGKVNTFVTDVRIFNTSFTNHATAFLEYFSGVSESGNIITPPPPPPFDVSNTNELATLSEDIPPRATIALDDVTGPNGLNSPGTIGGLRVTSQSKLVVTSRIFDDQRGNGKGTIGQSVNVITRANALTRGVIPHLTNDSSFRTNVGFFNPSTSNVVVRVELRDDHGALLGSRLIDLSSYEQRQLAIVDLFGLVCTTLTAPCTTLDLSNRPNLTLSFTASAPIDAYGSVIDNISHDPIAITAQSDSGVDTTP